MTQLNETQLSWVIERLTSIHHTSTPWNVRAELQTFIELLESRLKKEV